MKSVSPFFTASTMRVDDVRTGGCCFFGEAPTHAHLSAKPVFKIAFIFLICKQHGYCVRYNPEFVSSLRCVALAWAYTTQLARLNPSCCALYSTDSSSYMPFKSSLGCQGLPKSSRHAASYSRGTAAVQSRRRHLTTQRIAILV